MRRLLVIALLFAACQQETPRGTEQSAPAQIQPPEQQDVTGTATNTAMMDPTVPTNRDTPTSRAAAAATPSQAVHLIEYAVHMPQTLKAGRQSFQVENAGKEAHSFSIEGNGIHARLPSDLSRGSSAHFEVNLPPGTYTVYCPVGNHRQRGMETQVTVK